MNDVAAAPDRASQLNAALAHAQGSQSARKDESCPSCDKQGLAMLVALWAVVPPQNYPASIRENKTYVSHLLAHQFYEGDYLRARPLNKAEAGGSLECSQYVLRRLRQGFVYVYYPDGNHWEIYASQADGRLLRVNLDSPRPMGKGDIACKRFGTGAGTFLLNIDTKAAKSGKVHIGFSDAFWTARVRADVAGSDDLLSGFLKVIDLSNTGNIGSGTFKISDQDIENVVLGFQERPQTDTANREAYARPKSISSKSVYAEMVRINQAFDASGKTTAILLPLQDDIGIATQLNYAKSRAYTDIMGEDDSYTQTDRDKMDAAALLQNIRNGSSEAWSRIEDDINQGEFDTYLQKYIACAEATANYKVFSADYCQWMRQVKSKPYWRLFDAAVEQNGARLCSITTDLYTNCGQTETEFNEILLDALNSEPEKSNDLFWRGAAAADTGLLELLANPTIDKTILDAKKKFGDVKGQLELLGQIKEAKTQTAAANARNWEVLAATLMARSGRLSKAHPKAFRRTMRRIQLLTLQHSGIAVIEAALETDSTGYLRQLRNAYASNPRKINLTPKGTSDRRAVVHLIVGTWTPGQPIPQALQAAASAFAIQPSELPPSTITHVASSPDGAGKLKALVGMNMGIGAVQAFSLISSISNLGADLTTAASSGPNISRISKDIGEASVAALGLWATVTETRALAGQLSNAGAKSARYFELTLKAARLGAIAGTIDGIFQIYDASLLWDKGDTAAAVLRGFSGGTSAASAGTGYMAARLIARQAAAGIAGELAVGAATASGTARAGAVVTAEAPPVALWLGVASGVLFAVSISADLWSKYLTTIPLEKWADRSFLGKNRGKWGAKFKDSKEQLHTLLRELYAIKVDRPSYWDSLLKFEIEVPVWGMASKIDIKLKMKDRIIRWYVYENSNGMTTEASWPLKVAGGDDNDDFAGTGTAKGDGATFTITMGDQSWFEAVKNVLGMNLITPATRMIAGIPSIEVSYWPNSAAYDNFFVDGKGD
ncbi:TPA: hypothetical protein UOA92_000146 [Stenotrophomonas maltophilia]|uniref:toxin VasX n=1 Tax=Stenotrophomonas maltophilia TaxID=40324 RepID=UPI002402DA37|nr:toxin VasX [Stenotrophomonas maltophilia]HEL5052394.1 hypothetical protein [Stenotrophomonas maltophilia]